VRVTEPLGTLMLLTGTVDGHSLRYAAPPDFRPRIGETLRLRPRPGRERWMDADTGTAVSMETV
jgi:multiple sugar transport system ATP-binding protein